MPIVYINQCKNFSDAINNIVFEMSVPEYYDPAISNYFKEPRPCAKPIVNGEEMDWDEYLNKFPDAQPPDNFIPTPIYKSEDLNRAYSLKSTVEIIDLTVNNVPFEFMHAEDIITVIGIMDGYRNEVKAYINHNTKLKVFMSTFNNAYARLYEAYSNYINQRNRMNPQNAGPMNLAEILEHMTHAGGQNESN